MATVLLVRHGESLSNIGMATKATEHVPLSYKGFKQAEEIAQHLKARAAPDLIVHSPYQRAKQTAEPTINAFAYTPFEVWPVQEFTYLSAWREEHTTIEQRRPVVDLYWDISDPNLVDGPDCESFKEFIQRVGDIKQRIKSSGYEKIVIFSHEQFISAFIWLIQHDKEEITPQKMGEFHVYVKENRIPNGAIRRVRIRSRSGAPAPTGVSVMSEVPTEKENEPKLDLVGAASSRNVSIVPAPPTVQTPRASNALTSPQRTVVDCTPPAAQACQTGRSDGHVSGGGRAFLLVCLGAVQAMVKKLRLRYSTPRSRHDTAKFLLFPLVF